MVLITLSYTERLYKRLSMLLFFRDRLLLSASHTRHALWEPMCMA